MKTHAKKSTKPTLARRKTAPRKRRISLSLDAYLIASLDERGRHRSERISQDLSRYYRLLAETRFVLRSKFTTNRLALILDACNGWTIDAEAPRHLWIQVADAIRLTGLDEKWAEADPSGLIKRLQELTWLESLALADAIERFWYHVGKGKQRPDVSQLLE
ncbi:MAG TPA: hypothetical protein VJU54_01830 [Nitrospiraceae bacterium]|nr:hypothetical protein [Nitrospiraceae bacterium]